MKKQILKLNILAIIKELNKITIIDGYDIIAKDVNECEIIN